MADYEAAIYDAVSSAAKAEFETLKTASWPAAVPASFPFAYIVQTEDYDYAQSLTSNHENEARHLTFEVNVYSDKAAGRKAEAKAISLFIARVFKTLGFVQTMGGRPLDLTDAQNRSLARYMSRYEGLVHNDTIYTI